MNITAPSLRVVAAVVIAAAACAALMSVPCRPLTVDSSVQPDVMRPLALNLALA